MGETAFYEDAGDGFGYERGEYARRSVVCEVSRGGIFVRLGEREGSFVPERGSVNLELRGIGTPENVSANGKEAKWSYEEADERLVVWLAEDLGEVRVEAKFQTGT